MTGITVTEEISLYDVWRLLTATATKFDQLYVALGIGKSSLPVELSSPVTQRVVDCPFFTMARLRGGRYAL